jgi:hypothetical protein
MNYQKKVGILMGTRNLTVVKNQDGETLVAQYGQWDGYPEYTGKNILEFISNPDNLRSLKTGIEFSHFITDEKAEEIYENVSARAGVEAFKESYPSLTMDVGWEIIKIVTDNINVPLVNSIDFAEDSLFCEGYYEIDFQANKFISKWNGMTIEYSLDALPTEEDYLKSFEMDLTNA